MNVITVEQAKDSIRRLVEQKGRDYVYQSPVGSRCMYAHDGEPSCGIGVIMHEDYGVPIEELEDWDGLDPRFGSFPAYHILGCTDYVVCDVEVRKIFGRFQAAQDRHQPYKECAEQAGVEL